MKDRLVGGWEGNKERQGKSVGKGDMGGGTVVPLTRPCGFPTVQLDLA